MSAIGTLNRKLPKMLTGKNFRLTQTNCARVDLIKKKQDLTRCVKKDACVTAKIIILLSNFT